MLRLCLIATFVLAAIGVPFAQEAESPLTQRQACQKFSSAVVRIEAGGQSRGTGFLVSPDGFILTAAHVVTDHGTGQYFSAISVTLPTGGRPLARIVTPMTADNVGEDYVVLKVEGESGLPFLKLGGIEDAKPGSEVTIIGYPFSALTFQDRNVSTKFCLWGSITAVDLVTVEVTTRTGQVLNTAKKDVKADVIYFEGPSVKGISGSPVISRDTGNVMGIVSLKLTGIGQSLLQLRDRIKPEMGIVIGSVEPNAAIRDILTVLDDQLANGFGAAVGIDDPKHALTLEERKRRK